MAPSPARFDPAVILGQDGDRLAGGYALAAAKLLESGPTQSPTRLKAIRFLRLAIAHLED